MICSWHDKFPSQHQHQHTGWRFHDDTQFFRSTSFSISIVDAADSSSLDPRGQPPHHAFTLIFGYQPRDRPHNPDTKRLSPYARGAGSRLSTVQINSKAFHDRSDRASVTRPDGRLGTDGMGMSIVFYYLARGGKGGYLHLRASSKQRVGKRLQRRTLHMLSSLRWTGACVVCSGHGFAGGVGSYFFPMHSVEMTFRSRLMNSVRLTNSWRCIIGRRRVCLLCIGDECACCAARILLRCRVATSARRIASHMPAGICRLPLDLDAALGMRRKSSIRAFERFVSTRYLTGLWDPRTCGSAEDSIFDESGSNYRELVVD